MLWKSGAVLCLIQSWRFPAMKIHGIDWKKIKAVIGEKSKLTHFRRGRNLFGL